MTEPIHLLTNLAIEAKVDSIVRQMGGIGDDLKELTKAVTQLAVFEERQTNDRASIARSFLTIESQGHRIDVLERSVDDRLKTLENRTPMSDLTNSLVMKVVALIIAAVIGAVMSGMIRQPVFTAPSFIPAPNTPAN